jgi:hypothetical protein
MFWGGELLKPANIISITIGVIGIVAGAIIALYFYNKSERIGRISVAIEQVQVFDKARIGQLETSKNGSFSRRSGPALVMRS